MDKASNELKIDSHNLQYVMMERATEDEISLIDLWLVLVRRKKVFYYIILLSLIAGILFAFSRPPVYEYSAPIGIGTDQGGAVIEPIQTVLAKLQNAYIPVVVSAYNEKSKTIDIKAEVVKGSDIIRLSTTGIERDEKIYIQSLNDVIEKIKLDHKRVSSVTKKDLQLAIKKQENISEQLINEQLLMQSQIKRLNKQEQLLNDRIDNLSEFVRSNEKLRQSASKSKGDQGATLTLMMLDNELRSNRELLAKLKDQAYLSLANEREVLHNRIAANEKKQLENEQIVDKSKFQLANLFETRAIVKPFKSIKPVGTSKKLVLILFVVVGFMLALISVFIIEFLARVKTVQLER